MLLDSIWTWVGFNAALAALLFLDLVILTRRDHVVGMKEAGWLTAFWTLAAAGVGVFVWLAGGSQLGGEYLTAYAAERALSIDNLFVFIVIFGYFAVPAKYQMRALLWGIVGALIARALFIVAGLAVITAFSWALYILGAFLLYTAYKLAFTGDQEVDPEKNLALRVARRFMRVSTEYEGRNFFTRVDGVRAATPLLLVVLALGTTDVVFAVDSIPTVFGISTNWFVVWSSNAMAVLGMRPLFFLLAGLVKIFRFLQYGLAMILGFVGAKMIVEEAFESVHIDPYLSLGVIMGILGLSIAASAVLPDKDEGGEEAESASAGRSG